MQQNDVALMELEVAAATAAPSVVSSAAPTAAPSVVLAPAPEASTASSGSDPRAVHLVAAVSPCPQDFQPEDRDP
jgi:hypothetical protein